MNREEQARVRQIVTHPLYQQEFSALQRAEEDRIYCNHTMEHFLDVARICYILCLEEKVQIPCVTVYAAALLHDLGRNRQITEGIPHEEAGAELAEEILADCGFSEEERREVREAILHHRHHGRSQDAGEPEVAAAKSPLGSYLYRADKLSRLCFCCEASDSCNWSEDEKNKEIVV